MKKHGKKLNIGRETIRRLGGDDLKVVNAGIDTGSNTCVLWQCAQTSQAAICTVYVCVDTQKCPLASAGCSAGC